MRLVIVSLLATLCSGTLNGAEKIKHKFLFVDNGKNQLVYVDQFDPSKSWSIKTKKAPRDVSILSDKKTILLSVETGAVEYTLATGKKTGFVIKGYKKIQSANKLKDGNYLLATQDKIFICDAESKKTEDVPLVSKSSPYIRLVTVTKNNTLIYSAKRPFIIHEIALDGKVVASVKLPHKGYKAIRLENGNYMSSGGDSASVFELSRDSKVVRRFGGKKNHPKLELSFNSSCKGFHLSIQ